MSDDRFEGIETLFHAEAWLACKATACCLEWRAWVAGLVYRMRITWGSKIMKGSEKEEI